MIGAFARKFGSRDRVLSVEMDGGQYKVRAPDGATLDEGTDPDAPPPAFVERLPDEGGDVFLAPVLETLRAALRRRLGQADEETLRGPSENPEGASRAR